MVKDVELAGEVRRTMFPSWDSIYRGTRLCLYYRPYMKITGDILNFTHLYDDTFLMLMGDISGHGIQSALCMSAVNYSMATLTKYVRPENVTPQMIPHPVISAHIEFRKDDILLAFCNRGKRWDMQSGGIDNDRYADMLNETIFTVSYDETANP